MTTSSLHLLTRSSTSLFLPLWYTLERGIEVWKVTWHSDDCPSSSGKRRLTRTWDDSMFQFHWSSCTALNWDTPPENSPSNLSAGAIMWCHVTAVWWSCSVVAYCTKLPVLDWWVWHQPWCPSCQVLHTWMLSPEEKCNHVFNNTLTYPGHTHVWSHALGSPQRDKEGLGTILTCTSPGQSCRGPCHHRAHPQHCYCSGCTRTAPPSADSLSDTGS